ncbi:DJ-1/PfpI family protein [Curvibacter sp. CHRR-16]|uniref:DJ-1/PfpI family protein n=1 Tax=Curvibacter sp. CHRR-16 TaxID=2835872 RepID=UPI001BD946C6|nr:DJ-1/PfpI family protein [Curvibacter sp. CHRR-16]MBT0570367.1 DJ-1/PfpI family protein [Curvibacter sp. CHRR-16]
MHITILTFDGFNELDSFVALGVLRRARHANWPGAADWRVSICCPQQQVTSMNGVTVHAQSLLEEARHADAVLVGSGLQTRQIAQDDALLARLQLDPSRQLVASQCSGALLLAKLGLLQHVPACTDLTTKPWVQEAGVEVLAQPFFARGNVATAGGCLSAPYVAAWLIARLLGEQGPAVAREALHYVAPVGEKDAYVAQAMANIEPYL